WQANSKSPIRECDGIWELDVQVALDELAKLVAVFVFHVQKFDAVAVGADVADDGSAIDFAQAGAYFELDGLAAVELVGGLEISAAKTNGFDASEASGRTFNRRAKGRFERYANIAAWDDVARAGCSSGFISGADTRGRRTILEDCERIFCGCAQAGRF